ncbi:SpoIIE family protein phosphatase [Pseudonocardia kujensis]|uniref:SpoIIE family protein phosphatase n=1 Tax=Pseudonocardia kujensis TaxID=1128675 RepID=UPI001E3E517C|nr:SpoIIE family protein phosphatase [Pseudonocardia kujensis]MCE0762618.1 SpoIIE family protein phosphatase [Pseudonocardia kujensis]
MTPPGETLRPQTAEENIFARGGELGRIMAGWDWGATSVGPPETWPSALRNVVRILLGSRFSMWMGWGPELAFFYNDAYQRDTLRAKHPWALGRPAHEVWAEIWEDIGPRIASVLETGEATWDEDLLLILERSGYPEETYHTFSYSPLADDTGGIPGFLCVVTENTDRVLGERRMSTLRALSAAVTTARSERAVLDAACDLLGTTTRDLPFSLVYLFEDGDEGGARLACAAGIEAGAPAAPERTGPDGPWPVREARAGRSAMVDDLGARFAILPTGEWDRPPTEAVVVPLGSEDVAGFVVVGLNPYRRYDEGYRGFVELLVAQIASGLLNARAYETERHRAEALAELDRAKTDFFSNVSHEFRTPLTLIMGPVEELRAADGIGPERLRTELDVIHRNGLRLGRLVNSLLDYSRLQAGRIEARFEPLDLAVFTAELAGAFRSAIEHAGLELVIDCPPLPRPVHVDRDSWEKVVLNLLSNALKFTFEGGITVRLREVDGAAVLTVTDTGVGIPAAEIPRLFERFHRITGTRARSAEGSGIGLAMVRELAALHGGTVGAESTLDVGTTFTVTVPLGTAHLPAERVAEAEESDPTSSPTSLPTSSSVEPFVAEALRWLPSEPGEPAAGPVPVPAVAGGRVLVADDNADMRDYLHRLLASRYAVEVVADGRAALEAALADPPDLVVSDVMMPELDGMALLNALRVDPRTARVPVVLLSARAGQEAAVEGLAFGADDYLTKPFAARELLARVDGHLRLARARADAERRFRALADATPALIWADGADGGRLFVNKAWREYTGGGDADLGTGWRARIHPDDLAGYDERRAAAAGGVFEAEYRLRRADGRYRWVLDRGAPLNPAAEERGYVGGCLDIDDRYREQERQRVLGVLGGALEREGTVAARRQVLVRALVDEGVADLVRLIVVDESGAPRVVALAARDAKREADLARLDARSRWAAEVLADGRPATAVVDESYIVGASADPEQQDVRRRLDLRSVSLVPLAARGRVAGVLATARTGGSAPPQDALDLALLEEIGRRAATAIDNAQLFESEQDTSHRLTLLQEATAALSAAATPGRVAQTAVAQFAQLLRTSSVAMWEVRGSGTLESLHSVGWPPAVQRDWASVPEDARAPVADAVRRGAPVWVESAEDWERDYPHLHRLVREEYGYSGAAAVPLLVAGRCIGVVALGFVAPRRLAATERAAAVSLAEQSALALQRAELLAAESDARLAAEKFSRVVSALSGAARSAEVAAVILGHAEEIGATSAVVAVRRADQLEVLAAYPPTPVHWLAADVPRPLAYAARTGEPVWVGTRSPHAWSDRGLDEGRGDLPDQVAVPLSLGGTPLGVLGLRFPDDGPALSDEARAALLTVAEQCAQALDRARLHEAEHEIAAVLQRSLLPPEPRPFARLRTATRYRPGTAGVQAGGDWYDVFAVDDDRIALSVGDVVGQGPAAAAVMGQLRVALSGALRQGHPPAAALEILDAHVSWIPGARASTAACLLLDRASGTLRWARAGHLPPLLVDRDGARYLHDTLGPVLGLPDRPPFTEGSTTIRPGTTLLLYTDGLVERRGEIVDDGLARLAEAAARRAGETPDELVDHVLAEVVEQHGHADDIALVAVRLLPAPLQARYPASPEVLSGMRGDVRTWAEEGALPKLQLEDLQLALGEAAANAVDHAYRSSAPAGFDIALDLEADGGVRVAVRDHGHWRPQPADKGFRGRGLDLIRALADEVEIGRAEEGTLVTFRLPPAERNPEAAPVGPPAAAAPVARAPAGLTAQQDGAGLVLALHGDLDLHGIDHVREPLGAALARVRPAEPVVLDLTDVGYLPSAGIGMLLDLADVARARGVLLRIERPGTGPVARVLALTGLDGDASLGGA